MTSIAVGSSLATKRHWSPGWATASLADAVDTSPGDLSALRAHVDRCNGSRGSLFAIRCAVDSVRGFLAPRFVTTLVIIAIAIGTVSLVV